MNIQAPQIVYFALLFFSIGIAAAQHGHPKKGNESIWQTLVANAIMAAILYWGGFFTK